jgi:ribonuclease G
MTEDIDRIVVDSKSEYERIREVAARISRRAKSQIQLYEGDLPVFEHYKVEHHIEEVFSRRVGLKSGGHLVFDETEAMIAIDVNTGRHKGKGSQEEAILEVNTEAVNEVARQLRLRNIGGIIVIDLIDMKSRKHQQYVLRAMKAALKSDKARTNVLPISELGIMEMTRQRTEESISSATHIDCPYCHGRGSVKSPLGMSVEIQRQIAATMRKLHKAERPSNLQIVVHPTVLERLRNTDEQFLIDMEKKFEGKLTFKSDPSKHVEFFAVHNADTGDLLFTRVD